jgi:SAM-dependent MidA family methyltransferase
MPAENARSCALKTPTSTNMVKTEHLNILIADRIRKEGAISFRDYMDMALYFPGLGYYTSSGEKIGISGDYFTSPTITSMFGTMIGKQLEEMWTLMKESDLTIVEYGAGKGTLCCDILDYLKTNEKLYKGVKYCIIEKSPAMREAAFLNIGKHEKVSWHDHLSEIALRNACILTNEVVDNFPVHKVKMKDDLMEVFLIKDGKDYKEILLPAHDGLKNYLDRLSVKLPKNFCTEINLDAVTWIEEVADSLGQGFVITIDYGHESSELYSGSFRNGTVKCYRGHRMENDPYRYTGEQDITSHVNFSALAHWGAGSGAGCCGYTDQSHFLHALGVVNNIRELEKGTQAGVDEKELALLNTFLLDMGSKFKVLIQQKEMAGAQLSGMAFGKKLAV